MTKTPKTKAGRIKFVRKLHKQTQKQFADTLGKTRGAVGNWELGEGITVDNLTLISNTYSVPLDWLIQGIGQDPMVSGHIDSAHILPHEPTIDDMRDVRLVGYVGAGSREHRYAVEEQELERVHRPAGATPSTVALEIRGVSLGRTFDRWLVYYDERRSPVTPDMIGQLCVIGLADGRVLVKEIRRAKDGLFDLLSPNDDPIKGAAIEWGALVTDITRRR